MTQAINIPAKAAIIPAATFLTPNVLATYQTIEDVPYVLQAMETVMMYISWTGNVYHLNGPNAGLEGVVFFENLAGEHHLFFEQVTVEGAYQFGGFITRQNYLMRRINFRVFIGRPGMNNIAYRMCEDRWWTDQDEVNGGWLGVFTRFSGWRWIRVFPAKTVESTQKRDPVAYDNNQAVWDIDWLAPSPMYSKPAVTSDNGVASQAGPADADGFYHGIIAIPNRADMANYVRYLITGANSGTCIVQDNNSTNMVTLPPIETTDGDVLVDTNPIVKPIIAQNDPADDNFFALNNAAQVLGFFLQGATIPAQSATWLRGYIRFLYVTPPNSVVQLHVMHNNPNAQIAAQMPLWYKRSR
jgi:hypothetical protein